MTDWIYIYWTCEWLFSPGVCFQTCQLQTWLIIMWQDKLAVSHEAPRQRPEVHFHLTSHLCSNTVKYDAESLPSCSSHFFLTWQKKNWIILCASGRFYMFWPVFTGKHQNSFKHRRSNFDIGQVLSAIVTKCTQRLQKKNCVWKRERERQHEVCLFLRI